MQLNYSMKQCEADKIIINALNTLFVPVSTITHEPAFTIITQHFNRFKIGQEFEEKITNVCEKFSFLNYTNPTYNEGGHDHESNLKGVIGEITIDFNFTRIYYNGCKYWNNSDNDNG